MRPAPFSYDDPACMADALALLAEHGQEAKVLAGGQSLVPLLNFRLARPERLIDVNGVAELDYLYANGSLRIGALTRHAALAESAAAAARWPLLGEAARLVGHPAIRNRGTVGGSVAHADPAAELPAAFAALDARFHVHSARGSRSVHWDELWVGFLTTTIEPDELLVEIEVPAPEPRSGSAFVEFARRHGDFAIGGAAVQLALDADGAVTRAAIALLAAAPTCLRAHAAEQWLVGRIPDERAAAEAARLAAADAAPAGDLHGGADYRRSVIEAMTRRALRLAAARAA